MTAERLHAHVTAQALAVLGHGDAAALLRQMRREARAGRLEPTRRGFLAALATAAVGMTLDPERLLWTPTPIVTVSPDITVSGNTFVTPEWVMQQVAKQITENLRFMTQVHRDYSAQYRQVGVRGGDVVVTRLPRRYVERR